MTSHGRRWIVSLWLLLLLAIGARSAWAPARNSVYPIFAQAGRNWHAGLTCYGLVRAHLDIFRFSPVVAAAFVPFGALPDAVGGPLWLTLNAAVFFAGLFWYLRSVRDTNQPVILLLILPWALPSFGNLQA